MRKCFCFVWGLDEGIWAGGMANCWEVLRIVGRCVQKVSHFFSHGRERFLDNSLANYRNHELDDFKSQKVTESRKIRLTR